MWSRGDFPALCYEIRDPASCLQNNLGGRTPDLMLAPMMSLLAKLLTGIPKNFASLKNKSIITTLLCFGGGDQI